VSAGGNDSAPAISLAGARSAGAVALTAGGGGGISTGGGPITAQTGDITLTSGAGGISLSPATVSASPAANLQANGGDVVLLSTGTVQVDGGILSSHGNVCIGGDAGAACAGAQGAGRVATITSVAGGDIQAGSSSTDTGSISVYASQGTELQDLRVSTAGHVLVDSLGGVTLDHPLEGLGATPAGIGALTVNAGGDVKLAGAYVGGLLKVDTTGAISTVAPTGGALASLVGAGGVTLDGGTGVTLNGYPSGSAAVLAGYGADGTTVLNANAPVNINEARSGAVTIGGAVHATGAVNIGASGAPVASVTSTAAIQAGDVNGSSAPGIGVYATGNVGATDLFTRGALFISSTAGDVALSSAENGLGASSPLATLTISAGGNDSAPAISLAGAHSAGSVMLTAGGGGGISTGGGPITADTGDITLTSGAGGISLSSAAVSGSPASTLWAAGGNVVLLTSGTVQVDGGILSSHGNVCIGGGTDAACAAAQSAGRVAAITSVAGGDIQAGSSNADTGSISIYATQATGLQDLRVSRAGHVLVDSLGSVTLNHPLEGIGTTTPAGIGALTVNAGADLQLAGAYVTGNGGSASGQVNLTCTGANCAITDVPGFGTGIKASNAITLTANGDISIGIQYDDVGQSTKDALLLGLEASSGNVALSTTGQVLLDSSVRADNGNICIGGGAGAPCGSLQTPSAVRMAANPSAASLTGLQVGNALLAGGVNPTIWVHASETGPANTYTDIRLQSPTTPGTGEIWLGSLVGGPNVDVDIRSRDVTVLGAIAGANMISATDAHQTSPVTTGPEGMRSVTIFGDRAVDLRDVIVGTPETMQAPHDPNATARLIIETNAIDEVGTDGFAEPQQGNLNPTHIGISLRGPLVSYSPILIGLPNAQVSDSPERGQNAQINLSNNIFTYGQDVTLNGDVTLFNDIDLAMVFRQLAAGGKLLGTIPGAPPPAPYFDINTFEITKSGFDAVTNSGTAQAGLSGPIGNRFHLLDAAGQPLYVAQATSGDLTDILALFGQLTATIDTRNINKTTDPTASGGPTAAGPGDGFLNINGALARYVPPAVSLPAATYDGFNDCGLMYGCSSTNRLPPPPDPTVDSDWNNGQHQETYTDDTHSPPITFFSTSYVSPSFISQTLNLNAATFTINGNVGSGNPNAPLPFIDGSITATFTWDRQCPSSGPCTDTLEQPVVPVFVSPPTPRNAPAQGYFVVNTNVATQGQAHESAAVAALNVVNYPGDIPPVDASDPISPFGMFTCQPCAPGVPATLPTLQLFQFQFDASNPGAAAFPPGTEGAPSTNGQSPVLIFRGGSGDNSPFNSGPGSSSSATGAAPAGGSYSSTSGSGGNFTTGAQTGNGGNLSFVAGTGSGFLGSELNSDQSIVSTLTEDTRRQPETTDNAAADTTQRCPRGAARTADLGNQAAWSGSASNVFSSCPEAQGK
jgi:hypothetical protein